MAVVVPRKDIKRFFEIFVPKNFDRKLNDLLEKLLPFPRLSEETIIQSESLILDVAVSDYQLGEVWWLDFGKYVIFPFWRPKIELRARLYNYGTKYNVAEYKITKYLPWKYFFNRFLSYENKFQIGSEDTQVLLYKAVGELRKKIEKKFL